LQEGLAREHEDSKKARGEGQRDSRIATKRRRSGATPRITENEDRRLPKGSSTSSSRMKAEAKV
jgi:hypothetical protein